MKMTNRRRLAAEALLLILAGGGILWAQTPRDRADVKVDEPVPAVVRAREFQMVDKDGKVLAAMRVNPAFGGPVVEAREFHVVDDEGYVRAAMRLHGSEGGPDVTLWSRDRKQTVAQLSLNEGDRPVLILSGDARVLLDGQELVPAGAAE